MEEGLVTQLVARDDAQEVAQKNLVTRLNTQTIGTVPVMQRAKDAHGDRPVHHVTIRLWIKGICWRSEIG